MSLGLRLCAAGYSLATAVAIEELQGEFSCELRSRKDMPSGVKIEFQEASRTFVIYNSASLNIELVSSLFKEILERHNWLMNIEASDSSGNKQFSVSSIDFYGSSPSRHVLGSFKARI